MIVFVHQDEEEEKQTRKLLEKDEQGFGEGLGGTVGFYWALYITMGLLFGSYWPERAVLFLYKPGMSM